MRKTICLFLAMLMMMPSIPVYAESIPGTPYNEENYDVTVSHVMINQIYAGGYCDYSFIELYNPTEQDIDLSSWSLHYIPSMEGGDSVFSKLDLTGTIPAHCSYLVRCNKTSKVSGGITLNGYDQEWDQVIYTKGCSVVLMSNQEELETTELFNGIPLVEGYVDMLAMSGNDGIDEQKAICFESEAPAIQSKKKGIRRDHFMDCDDNANDTMIADYSFGSSAYINYIRPRSSNDGVWEDGNMPTYTVSFDSQGGSEIASQIHVYYTAVNQPEDPVKEGYIFSGWYHGEIEYNFETLPETDLVLIAKWEAEVINHTKAEITALKAKVPKYLSYYTSASVSTLNTALSKVNSTNTNTASQTTINSLYDQLNDALNNLMYKTSDVPVVYVSTNDSVGAKLEKEDGYVYTDLAIVDKQGNTIEENDTAQIKVRGNSTAKAPKKPYNVKFSSKQNVLGMGKAKKWTLLANYYDVTLLKNYVAFEMAEHLGLAYTSKHEMVDVYVDGVFLGNYLLAESVQAGSTRVDIDINNGDFLIEYDTRNESDKTYLRFDDLIQFQMADPEEPIQEQAEYAYSVMDDILKTMKDGDYSEVEKKLDIESFAKFYMVNTVLKNIDFNFSSIYFYYKEGILYAGPVWDFDGSVGGRSSYRAAVEDQSVTYVREYCNVYKYLCQYPQFKAYLQNLYFEYQSYFKSIATDRFQELYEQYKGTITRNYSDAGWKVDEGAKAEATRYPTYQENLDYAKNWLKERCEALDEYFAKINEYNAGPVGRLETISYANNQLNVSGYCFDNKYIIIKETIDLYANEQYIGSIQTGKYREDICKQYGIIGNFGFSGSFNIALSSNVWIKAYASDINGNKILLSGTKLMNSTTSNSYNATGSISKIESKELKQIHITGKAYDQDDMNQVVYVNVYIDQELVGMIETNRNHEFDATLSTRYIGEHTITLKAIDLGTNKEYVIGSKVLDICSNGFPTTTKPATYVDFFNINTTNKTVDVGGWGFDRDDTYLSVDFKLYANNQCIGTLKANRNSPDVNELYLIPGSHRFSGTVQFNTSGQVVFELRVVDLGGNDEYLVKRKTVMVGGANHVPVGCIDSVSSMQEGKVYLAGWTYDQDNTTQSLEVKAYIGNQCIGTLIANQARPDVNSAFNITGNHGFSGTLLTDYSGVQTIVIKAVDPQTKQEVEIGKKSISIQAKPDNNTTLYTPQGVVESIICSNPGEIKIAGWAYDQDDHTVSIDIKAYIGEICIGTLATDKTRTDVNQAFNITGNHGFSDYIATDYTGEQTIVVKAVDLYTKKEYVIGSKLIEIIKKEEVLKVDTIFDDVDANTWYSDYVQYVYDHGLMTGIGGTNSFGTYDLVTREQMVQVLYNMAGRPQITDYTATTKFNDVYKGAWFEDAINWAYNNGVTVGMGDSFGVGNKLTREQMVIFFKNYANYIGKDTTQKSDISTFVDYKDVNSWSKDSLEWAVATQLVSGAIENDVAYLQPQGHATRVQLATVLTRFIQFYNI